MKTKILIVDDNEQNLYLLRALLEGYGHEVVQAYDGKDALEKAHDSPPDMVVSDILMPVMDGFTLCRRWKKNDRLKKIPFIFYTATYTDSKDEEFALSLGAERFIVKPVEPEEFIKIIQDIMSDLENGKIKPKKPVLEKDNDIFKIYNERLVQKLEKKMLDMEKELANRKRAEEKLAESCEHLEELVEERTKSLRKSEAKFSGIVSAITDGICMIDEHHNILWVNQAMVRLFGPELMGKKCYEVFHLREVACESCIVEQTFACGRSQEFESECLTVDGRKIPVWCVSGVADRHEDGRPKTVIYVCRDISERKRMETTLRESEKLAAVGRLAARIAHEINNPLAGIKTSFQIIKSGIPKDYHDHEFVELIDKKINRISRIVHQVFDLYQENHNDISVFPVNQCVQDIITLTNNACMERDVTIKLDVGATSSITVKQMEPLLKEVLFNIILNALDASPSGETIKVATAVDKNDLTITVSDHGCGIPEEMRPHVFEPFFTTKHDSHSGKGLGLGLSISRNTVESMGGALDFETELGYGTVFRITIPLEVPDDTEGNYLV